MKNVTNNFHHLNICYFYSIGTILSNIPRPLLSQAISQNQGQTPLTSRSVSNISGLAMKSTIIQTNPVLIDPLLNLEHLHMRTAVPIGTVLRLQETPNPVRDTLTG
jgi:hypothetical protein